MPKKIEKKILFFNDDCQKQISYSCSKRKTHIIEKCPFYYVVLLDLYQKKTSQRPGPRGVTGGYLWGEGGADKKVH